MKYYRYCQDPGNGVFEPFKRRLVYNISGEIDLIPDCSCHKTIFLLFSISADFE